MESLSRPQLNGTSTVDEGLTMATALLPWFVQCPPGSFVSHRFIAILRFSSAKRPRTWTSSPRCPPRRFGGPTAKRQPGRWSTPLWVELLALDLDRVGTNWLEPQSLPQTFGMSKAMPQAGESAKARLCFAVKRGVTRRRCTPCCSKSRTRKANPKTQSEDPVFHVGAVVDYAARQGYGHLRVSVSPPLQSISSLNHRKHLWARSGAEDDCSNDGWIEATVLHRNRNGASVPWSWSKKYTADDTALTTLRFTEAPTTLTSWGMPVSRSLHWLSRLVARRIH